MTAADARPIVLVTGAAGNLGRSVAKAQAHGYRIVGLDRKTREMGRHASHVDCGMRRVYRLLAQVPSIHANVLRRLGLQEDETHAGHGVQGVLQLSDARARFEVNFRRNTP